MSAGGKMRQRRNSSPARAWWYAVYRGMRIVRRECVKAARDVLLFGTGVVETGESIQDYIRHVPVEEFYGNGEEGEED
jgi:hypothetical protein